MKARAVSYGAVELKQMEHRYMAAGLLISVVIHLCVITAYILKGLVVYDRPPFLPPQPPFPRPDGGQVSILNPVYPPGTPDIHRGGGSKRPGEKYALPIPVPIPPANEDTLLFKPGNPGSGVGSGEETENEGGGVGPGPGTIVSEEEPPLPFVPVERDPVMIKKVNPAYPELAVRSGLEGRVWVNIWVDREGRAHRVVVTRSTSEIFNESAVAAAKQFAFIPAYTNGGPVSVWVTVPFTFRINR